MDAPKIYHADPYTGQFCGVGVADPDPLEEGNWLIPAWAYVDEPPPAAEGYAVVRSADQSTWGQVEDNRGAVYLTATGEQLTYKALGPLPSELTRDPYPGAYYNWNGAAWVLDEPAQLEALRLEVIAQRDERLALAALRIAPLQDAADLGTATGEETSALLAWKGYRVDLNRIEQQEGFPTAVDWPPSPEDPQSVI